MIQNCPKIAPKWTPNSSKIAPKWLQNSSKIAPKMWSVLLRPIDPLLTPYWLQNAPKWVRNFVQNCQKMMLNFNRKKVPFFNNFSSILGPQNDTNLSFFVLPVEQAQYVKTFKNHWKTNINWRFSISWRCKNQLKIDEKAYQKRVKKTAHFFIEI